MLDTVPPTLLSDLKTRHAEPQRHYHDWTHIAALLAHRETLCESLNDADAVLYAVLFHDAVYDPKAGDNETRSAELLMASAPPLSPESLIRAQQMIEATARHLLPDDMPAPDRRDCAYFLDMDLGILGAAPDRFDIYEDQIRREYAHVPDDAFRTGRAAILRRFAERGRLYFSDWGLDRFEAQARANIARSLARLAG